MNGSCCSPRNGSSRTAVVAVPTFGSFFSDVFHNPAFVQRQSPSSSPMPLDIIDEPNALVVRALVPGFTKDQIEVNLTDGILTIATTACDCAESTGNVLRREISCSAQQRRLRLPFPVIEDQIKGEVKDGVLTLTLPKVPEPQPRKIPIEG